MQTIVNELLVMSHAEREFQDTPVNRRPIHEAGNDADSSNSGDGGDDDNHSGRNDDEDDDGDLHNMNTNEPTYTHNVDDIHESEMGHVYEDDVMNLSVSLGHEEERFEPSNFATGRELMSHQMSVHTCRALIVGYQCWTVESRMLRKTLVM